MKNCKYYKSQRVVIDPSQNPGAELPEFKSHFYCDLNFDANMYRRMRKGDPSSAPEAPCEGDVNKCDQEKYREIFGH